jgi:hypothetical protein
MVLTMSMEKSKEVLLNKWLKDKESWTLYKSNFKIFLLEVQVQVKLLATLKSMILSSPSQTNKPSLWMQTDKLTVKMPNSSKGSQRKEIGLLELTNNTSKMKRRSNRLDGSNKNAEDLSYKLSKILRKGHGDSHYFKPDSRRVAGGIYTKT